jgi:hypothetical protein
MKPHKTECMIIIEAYNGDLQDFPPTEETSISFDATDLSMAGWVYQFKRVLAVAGFTEKTITDFLGDA